MCCRSPTIFIKFYNCGYMFLAECGEINQGLTSGTCRISRWICFKCLCMVKDEPIGMHSHYRACLYTPYQSNSPVRLSVCVFSLYKCPLVSFNKSNSKSFSKCISFWNGLRFLLVFAFHKMLNKLCVFLFRRNLILLDMWEKTKYILYKMFLKYIHTLYLLKLHPKIRDL